MGHQPLIAAVERGFDDVGMFDIHAQPIGHQPANEAEFLLAMPQHTLDALADSFALGFQILKQFLP